MTSSSTMNKDLTVYEVVTALDSLSECLKSKLVEYMNNNDIIPDDENFTEISNITIQDLQK